MTATISTDNTSGTKQRVIKTVVAVLVAHVIVLGLLATMKPIQLKMPDPPKPVEVKFIQLAPPPKPETPKPEPKPKPKEVKVVKEVPKPKPLPKPKPVIATAEPSPRPQPVVVPQPEPKPEPKVEPLPAPAPPKPAAPAPTPPAPPAQPMQVDAVVLIKAPRIEVSDDELKGQARTVKLRVNITEMGKVGSVDVLESSGIPALDRKIASAFKRAIFSPYRQNGVAVPVYMIQPYTFNLSSN